MKRQPFNDQNPNGPLELCTCATCGSPIMLDDKQHRIRVIVPNLMGYGSQIEPPAYPAFYNPDSAEQQPRDGRPSSAALRPAFLWPQAALAGVSSSSSRHPLPRTPCPGPFPSPW